MIHLAFSSTATNNRRLPLQIISRYVYRQTYWTSPGFEWLKSAKGVKEEDGGEKGSSQVLGSPILFNLSL